MRRSGQGTFTFLFTDIVASTPLVGAVGDDRWTKLLAEHDAIIRSAVAKHGGQHVSTAGDGSFAVFDTAADAVHAAVQAQRDLLSPQWTGEEALQVRMGLHTGTAIRMGDDVVGFEVHRAARIAAAGHGGQILLSRTTADLLGRELGRSVSLVDLGSRRLKGLAEPEQLLHVVAEGLPGDFPPIETMDEGPRHNLPAHLTSFVGRARDIDDVVRLMQQHRLVTITGAGGSGKTRLATEAAMRLTETTDRDVFFVDLAPVGDVGALDAAVAEAVGVPQLRGAVDPRPLRERLMTRLSSRDAVLLVDNCEHLLDACAELVEDVLHACRHITVLATSREPLGVDGERVWIVPTLPMPADGSLPAARASDAVQLFCDRAVLVQPAFRLTEENCDSVGEICRRLDGMPLALELAAAQVAHLSPADIAARLTNRFRLLVGGRRRIQRQQTLQAAIDWSHTLLDEREQILFRRLASFAGSFTVTAAEAICGVEPFTPGEVVVVLGSLVTKSMLTGDGAGETTRYRMLETVRLYAEQKLDEAGEAEELRSRHRDWFLAWAESFEERSLVGASIEAFEAEAGNIRAALAWSHQQGRPDLVGRLLVATSSYWYGQNPHEGIDWLGLTVTADGTLPADVRRKCLSVGVDLSLRAGEPASTALVRAEEALEASADHEDMYVARLLATYALYLSIEGALHRADRSLFERADRLADRAMTLSLQLGREVQADTLHNVALVRLLEMRYHDAVEAERRALELVAPGEAAGGFARYALSIALHLLGERREAYEVAQRVASLRLGLFEVLVPVPLAISLAALGEPEAATQLLRHVLPAARSTGSPVAIGDALVGLAVAAAHRGDLARTLTVLGFVLRNPMGNTPMGGMLAAHYYRLARDRLGLEEARSLRRRGAAASLEEIAALALSTSDEQTYSTRPIA